MREPLTVSAEQCRDWPQSSELEWLETNGAGGFAMGTVSGANTRRYHGLLVASLRAPVERHVLLARVEEELLFNAEPVNLGAAQYPGVIAPAGFRMLEEFRLDPFPTWSYRSGSAQVEKRMFLVQGQQTAVIQYRVSSPCRFRVRPFLAFRDHHSLQHARDDFRRDGEHTGQTLRLRPFELLPGLCIHHNAAFFVPAGHWYYRNEYRKEMERGLDFTEDLFSPGWLEFELDEGGTAFLVATIEDAGGVDLSMVREWEAAERRRRAAITRQAPGLCPPDEFRARLEAAAEQFLVRRADGSPTIIAGYPWFSDWGRDTMISLRGLLIARGRLEESRQILEGFLKRLDRGLIPNRFPDTAGNPEYNTADATLWMFPAAWALMEAGYPEHFFRETFYPAAKEILGWHRRGTHFGIRVDASDGLLIAGDPGTQLTWMDAKAGDWVVTPRHGKPVEINALWYNALRMTAWWARRFGEEREAEELSAEAARVLESFEQKFWNPARGCLYDRLVPEGPDDRLRPNQLFALCLPFPLIEETRQRSIVDVVTGKLLTPFGLRTLDPEHPEYRPRYEGGPRERDGAYHQGSVWPWLMGPYISARLQAYGPAGENLQRCRELMDAFAGELRRGCLGTLCEIYDAEPPHRPVGAAAQAWSVAELLRVMAVM
ncbi:MAG: glycogen debranching enzyme family protein [Acidobacteria bacterium]|nr:glycogen debranching enzyme family protein [Acidobacteriota bacterium]